VVDHSSEFTFIVEVADLPHGLERVRQAVAAGWSPGMVIAVQH
jgi:hypothetical protein